MSGYNYTNVCIMSKKYIKFKKVLTNNVLYDKIVYVDLRCFAEKNPDIRCTYIPENTKKEGRNLCKKTKNSLAFSLQSQ